MTDLLSATWRKSSYSGTSGQCVEVADYLDAVTAVRDSKDPTGSALVFDRTSFTGFLESVKIGELDR
ncbi:hypothetical protein FHR84_003106 [Actinopolyspora biskrensis]|uniref:DUF397 domain-containing protein n=1 Tax=Actinopolyspora biskrensis TaxID=1470178 RepID=A0A852YZZ0_9ACTN|nr:DUF397 domain-containing protein [Actinopolyspora biskrensis]NYH79768.1 hypothetical protein [Actinopolyspora biskrensis]